MTDTEPLEVSVVTHARGLQQLAREWRELADGSGATPFLSFDWTWACWRHGRRFASTLHVVTGRRGGHLVAVAPLCVGRFGVLRVLRYIAEGRSDYLGVLAASEADGVELLQSVASMRTWDIAVLISSRVPTLTDGTLSLPAYQRVLTTSSYMALDGDWSALVAEGPNWLQRMRRKLRKFEAAGGRCDRYYGADAAARIAAVAEVERKSWRSQRGLLHFADEKGRGFFAEALTALGPTKGLELWIASIGDQPIAFELNLRTTSWIGLYFGAHDEEHRSLGPGAVLEFVSIRQAWSEGVREYDYLAGAEAYKSERTRSTRPVYLEIAASSTTRGRLTHPLVTGGYEMYRWWKLRARAPMTTTESQP